MKLKLQHEDWDASTLSPSCTVDLVWHQHMLDPVHYVEACQAFTSGHVVGHNPDGGLDVAARMERIKTTKISLRSLFGKDVDSEVWSFRGDADNAANDNNNDDDNDDDNNNIERNNVHSNTEATAFDMEEKPQKNPKKRGREPAEVITICLQHYIFGKIVYTYYKLAKSTELSNVESHYANWTGIRPCELRLLHDGERIEPTSTPAMRDMHDQERIDVMMAQGGC